MKKLIVVLSVLGAGVGLGYSAAPRGPYPVRPRLMATATSVGSYTFDWDTFCVNKDRSAYWAAHFNSSTGRTMPHTLRVAVGCTQVIDGLGTVAYTTTGGSDPVCTAITTAANQSDTLAANCATGGKCVP